MKCLFVCSSAYQMLNAICIGSEYSKKGYACDIIFMNRDVNNKDIFNKIDNLNLFRNKYLIKFIDKQKFLFLIILFPKIMFKLLLIDSNINKITRNYDIVFCTSWLYAVFTIKLTDSSKCFLIEEGISSYTGRATNLEKKDFKNKLLNKFLFSGNLNNYIKGVYLHLPDLLFGTDNKLKTYEINFDKELIPALKSVFDCKKINAFNHTDFIYLGAPIFGMFDLSGNHSSFSLSFERKVELKIVESLNTFNRDILYRKHALEVSPLYDRYKLNNVLICNRKTVWELYCWQFISDETVLISFFSSAAFTPKLLYGKEPYLIFIHKILKLDIKNSDHLINNLKKSYRDPKKIICPSSLLELSNFQRNIT